MHKHFPLIMKTTVLKLDSASAFERSVQTASDALASGAVIGLVTDTVYGLVANSDDAEAMRRLVALKRRPPEKPFTMLIAETGDMSRFGVRLTEKADRLCRAYWPGPVTLVVPAREGKTVGFRVPAHAAARQILERSGVAAAAPSANPHGEAPALTAREVLDYFDGQIEYVVDGGRVSFAESSTVVQVEEDRWEILREGIVTRSEIVKAMNFNVLFICAGNTCRSPLAEVTCRKLLAKKLGTEPGRIEESGYSVESCGTSAAANVRASEHSAKVARERGMDLSKHWSQPISTEILKRADRIYTMTRAQLVDTRGVFPDAADRMRTLDPEGDIPDPIGKPIGQYRRLAHRMEELIRDIVEEIVTC